MGICSSNNKNIPHAPPAPPRVAPPPPPAPPVRTASVNTMLNESLHEMNKIRKPIHDKAENEVLRDEGKAVLCCECQEAMPHITSRECTCHNSWCSKHNTGKSCTIYRKISRI